MTRADRSLIRQCILDAAQRCVAEHRTVLTPRDVRDALRERGRDATLPEIRRTRLLEMADAMDMFCQAPTARCSIVPAHPGREADITRRSGDLRPRRLQRPTLDLLHLADSCSTRTTSPSATSSGASHPERDRRRSRHHQEPLLSPYVVKITRCGASSARGIGWPRRTWTICLRPPSPCST